MKILLLIATMLLTACSSEGPKGKSEVITKEDFMTFLNDFSQIEEFQKERLDNNLIECEISTDGDSTCYKLPKQSWQIVELIDNNEVRLIYDNYNHKLLDNSERVFSIEGIESGSATFYYFKLEKGKWYLFKRVIYL